MILFWVCYYWVLGTSWLILAAALYRAKTATGAILPWKWVKAVTQPSTGIRAHKARRERGRSPGNISLLHQFEFQLRYLLTKQTWLLYHSNAFVTSNSFSYSFSSLLFPCNPLPFARNPPSLPTMLYYLYGKKKNFRSCFLPSVTSTHSYLVMSSKNSLSQNVCSFWSNKITNCILFSLSLVFDALGSFWNKWPNTSFLWPEALYLYTEIFSNGFRKTKYRLCY